MGKHKVAIYSIAVHCKACRSFLFNYRKEGAGELVKCFCDGISEDETKEPGVCHKCGSTFARERMIKGRPALKIVGGKVNTRGHHG